MDQLLYVIAGIIILGLFMAIIAPFVKKLIDQDDEKEVLPYRQKRFFFSKSEQELYRILLSKLDGNQYQIFPKVRLADFIEVDLPKGERQSAWNRIKSKHIDFLVWDTTANKIAAAIELDGRSHNHHSAHKNDYFKNKLFSTIGLNFVRINVGSNFEQEIEQMRL